MPAYCTEAQAKAGLPDSLPTDMNSAYFTTAIADASAEVDSLVGGDYPLSYASSTQRFPDVSDTPATPAVIKECAVWLTMSRAYMKLDVDNVGGDGETRPRWQVFRALAEEKLRDIAGGRVQVILSGADAGTGSEAIGTVDRMTEAEEDNSNRRVTWTEMDKLWP